MERKDTQTKVNLILIKIVKFLSYMNMIIYIIDPRDMTIMIIFYDKTQTLIDIYHSNNRLGKNKMNKGRDLISFLMDCLRILVYALINSNIFLVIMSDQQKYFYVSYSVKV